MAESDKLVLVQSAEFVNNLWSNYQNNTSVLRSKWIDYYKQYRGISNRKNYEGFANVFVNETLQAVESIVAQEVSNIFVDPKYLYLKGREETDELKAELLELMMVYELDNISIKDKIIKQLRQRAKYGTTVAKVVWKFEEREVIERTSDGLEKLKKTVKDNNEIEYIDLFDIAFDPGRSEIEDMDWVIIRKRITWDDIKFAERNGIYSSQQISKINKEIFNRSMDSLNNKAQRMGSIGINYDQFINNQLEILEFWGKIPRWWIEGNVDDEKSSDLIQGNIEVVLNGVTLKLDRNQYAHQEIPVVKATFISSDDEAFGIGVCEIAEKLQQELNDKRNQSLDHATEQIAPPLVINRQAHIDEKRLKIQPYGKIPSDLPGDQAISPLRLGGNYVENVTFDSIIKQDIRNETGATNPIQGVPSQKESTAFEVSALQQRGSARINVSTIQFSEKFLKRTYKLMWKNIQQFTTTEKAIKVIGSKGVKWEKISPEDLIIDADIIPKVSLDADNRMIVRNQLIQFITQLVPQYPRINTYKIIKKIYSLFGFDDADDVIPEPDIEKGQNDLSIEEEIKVLSLGQNVAVDPFDNHLFKISALMDFLKRFGQNLSPQALNAFNEKISQHTQYIKNIEQIKATFSSQRPEILSGGIKPKIPAKSSLVSDQMASMTRV